jgi:hypothetical protein
MRRVVIIALLGLFALSTAAINDIGAIVSTTHETLILRPNGDGHVIHWSRQSCSANWDCLDELNSDGDSTYVTENRVNRFDFYNFEDASESGSILNVTVYVYARESSSDDDIRLCVFADGYCGNEKELTDSYILVSETWASDPRDGNWNWSDINDLEAGFRYKKDGSKSNDVRVTQLYVVIEYDPQPPTTTITTTTSTTTSTTTTSSSTTSQPITTTTSTSTTSSNTSTTTTSTTTTTSSTTSTTSSTTTSTTTSTSTTTTTQQLVIYIFSPENRTYSTNPLSLNFSTNVPTSWSGYRLDNSTNITILNGNTTLGNMTNGSHHLMVMAIDTAGNFNSTDVWFTLDKSVKSVPEFPIGINIAFLLAMIIYLWKRKKLISSSSG